MPNDTYHCREVLHCGDGPPGPERRIRAAIGQRMDDGADAAKQFVALLVDEEMRSGHHNSDNISLWHNSEYTVEVRAGPEAPWERFGVSVRAVLQFEAEREGE